MLLPMQPETGGRFTVRLLSHDPGGARFQLELATHEGTWGAQADVSIGEGSIQWGTWAGSHGEPPEWLCQYTRAALRSAWRQHQTEGWPRRLTRWRDVPAHQREGGGSQG